jgi:glutaredoxin
MMQLYVKTNCPFSARARAVLDAYQVAYEERNIEDEKVLTELLELGGKKQTPFLVDGEEMMYESQTIESYIERKCEGGVCEERRIDCTRAE